MEMYRKFNCCVAFLLVLAEVLVHTAGQSLQVHSKNVHEVVHSSELVLLLFYTHQCPFSVRLLPSFDAAADYFRSQQGDAGQVTLGKVDCGQEYQMENEFDIGKYPTVKIVRHQQVSRQEYRGQRTTQAIIEFVLQELQDPIAEFDKLNSVQPLNDHRYLLIGYFQHKNHAHYESFRKLANVLKHKCQFHVNFDEANALSKISFRRSVDHLESDGEYSGDLANFVELLDWSKEKCEPTIRVLTYDNVEELSEEGKPFIILFHDKDDTQSPKDFANVVSAELMQERDQVIFLTADGNRFTQPLAHLNKSSEDLPLIAVDSFVHMFLFPKFRDLYKPGKLKQFLNRLHSGELHWSMHFIDSSEEDGNEEEKEKEKEKEETTKRAQAAVRLTKARESKFKELLPSKHRYTFARDEL